jgi:DNA-binding SARP family transcriptional activator/tetratricopeptide (TPR) repeat protein
MCDLLREEEHMTATGANTREFRLLGPLEVRSGGRVLNLGPPQRRALLAILLLHANEVVPRDRLIDTLWSGDPPTTAVYALHNHISELRKLLGARFLPRAQAGYTLSVDDDALDVRRFERLVDEGRRALPSDPGTAADLLRDALALWRGEPLVDVTYATFAQPEIRRLEGLRAAVVEDRIEADLALGRHGALVAELDALVTQFPLRERLYGQLMLALYRSGRQADALALYRRARTVLIDELGIEPGHDLQRLERAILGHDEELDLTPAAAARATTPTPAGNEPDRSLKHVRKLVTVVVCGLGASAKDGEHLDPESLEPLMRHACDAVRGRLERHGGSAIPSPGDEVVVVFGIPAVHEDDAVRATRGAEEARAALAELTAELEVRRGIRFVAGIGIAADEVMATTNHDGAPLISGDVVATARHLGEHASPGDIVVSPEIKDLLGDSVTLHPLASGDGSGYLVREIDPGVRSPRRRLPLVGRDAELASLSEVLDRAVRDRSCRLVTIIGPAGIGKSRLIDEFLSGREGVTIARGRCLPYGEGITFWPIVEVVNELASIRDDDSVEAVRAKVSGLLPSQEDAAAVTALVTDSPEAVSGAPEETYLAVRRLFEAIAEAHPLVVVFDDLQWAEPTLLDLLEYLVGWSRDRAIVLCCLARPELLASRPTWALPASHADVLALEPLEPAAATELAHRLLGSGGPPPAALERIVRTAGGNPLFLEELARVLVEDGSLGHDDARTPALPRSLSALLAARLEQLEPDELAVIERAAAIGEIFWWGAVKELASPELAPRVGRTLQALVRKQLIAPSDSSFAAEDAFRFGHILVRDAAYARATKGVRADFHERFSQWLETRAGEGVREYDELIGYQLEQACHYRRELAPDDARADGLAGRAAASLGAAGRRAIARADTPAATILLTRAAALLPPLAPELPALSLDLGVVLREQGELARAEQVLEQAIPVATAAEQEAYEARLRIEYADIRAALDPMAAAAELRTVARDAIVVLERLEDDVGLGQAYKALAEDAWLRSQGAEMEGLLELALHHAERGRDERMSEAVVTAFGRAVVFGPTRVDEAVVGCQELLERFAGRRAVTADLSVSLAVLEAARGEIDQARMLCGASLAVYEELGLRRGIAFVRTYTGIVELLAGDLAHADRELAEAYRTVEEIRDLGALATTAALLARAKLAQGREDEAQRLCSLAEATAAPDDSATQVIARGAHALIVARRGDLDAARALATEAVEIACATDFLSVHGDALMDLSHVLRAAGDVRGAGDAARGALDLYAAKGALIPHARASAWLEDLDLTAGV